MSFDKWLTKLGASTTDYLVGYEVSTPGNFIKELASKYVDDGSRKAFVFVLNEDMQVVLESHFILDEEHSLVDQLVHTASWVDDGLTNPDGDYIGIFVGYNINDIDQADEIDGWVDEQFDTIQTLDTFLIKDGYYKSAMCNGVGCCPEEGFEIKPVDNDVTTEKFISDGDSMSDDELGEFLNSLLVKLNITTDEDEN